MRERFKRQPWKGCGVVRHPWVRIPPYLPMCDNCTKRAQSRDIINLELKIDSLFKKIEQNPEAYKHDPELLRLCDTMAEKLKWFNSK